MQTSHSDAASKAKPAGQGVAWPDARQPRCQMQYMYRRMTWGRIRLSGHHPKSGWDSEPRVPRGFPDELRPGTAAPGFDEVCAVTRTWPDRRPLPTWSEGRRS